ncbi:uncharacterized protein BDZ99DRAFT_387401 [Mytilinidion resinicola]|uniref:Serine-threonine protein kinase 19 n=1 Tax=Mytilinidion resinicola TaxID=574789 RepID=A0A6A6YPB1_9PEZI|nr:uncharacterized protein BDZ99DRAFT_387401 [Mytilinidion resinicola]KAF2810389.1 hypothetical protein BDZ99DRAFT_387401 [Mytilinidion resinicola]
MSFQLTSAHSSRITKSRRPKPDPLGLRRSSTGSPRRKSSQASPEKKTSSSKEDEFFDEKLDDMGIIASLATDLNFRDVPMFLQYIQSRMFSDIPERASGMNGARIADVLNYRLSLPPIVTLAHIHALSKSPTTTEREIAELARAGVIRKIAIPNRGTGASTVGEGLVLVSEWERLVQSHPGLDEEVKAKYISLLKSNPTTLNISGIEFTPNEASALTEAGFLTTASASSSVSSLFARPGAGSLGTLASLATAGSKNASGSLAAVGGAQAQQNISGGGSGRRTGSLARYNFSLPNTGVVLRLIVDARNHLLGMLKKTKYREAPRNVLHERWDGEFTGVLPGRTKKWRQLNGIRFEWILEECVGAGLVELFETGSVGIGVRAT